MMLADLMSIVGIVFLSVLILALLGKLVHAAFSVILLVVLAAAFAAIWFYVRKN